MQIQRFESITQKYPQFPTALLANEEPIQNGEPFILYGTKLDMTKLEKFQQKCSMGFIQRERLIERVHMNRLPVKDLWRE